VDNVDDAITTQPVAGQEVFRVWGNSIESNAGPGSDPWGHSWTPIDPSTVTNFRDAAGIPSGGESGAYNAARFVSQGIITDPSGIIVQSATPLDGNSGGLLEYIFPRPEAQILLENVCGINPPY